MSHRVCMLKDGFANSMELARFGGICQNEMAAYVRIHGTGAIWNLDGMAFTIQVVNSRVFRQVVIAVHGSRVLSVPACRCDGFLQGAIDCKILQDLRTNVSALL